MKSIITLVTFVLLLASSALSQGLAKEVVISKRTPIKDSLGNTLRLSDCTKRLNTKEWVLHPEKNEQGKLIYYLLKRTTPQEAELRSNQMVSGISQEQFDDLKRGRFIVKSDNGDVRCIRRRGNKQVERIKKVDGSKQKTKYRIAWLDDGSYIVKPWDKVTEMSKTPRYKLVEVTETSHTVRVIQKSSLGPAILITNK